MSGMTLVQILQKTTASRIELSAYVAIKNLKMGISKKLGVQKAIAESYSPERFKGKTVIRKYATMIEFHDRDKVKVSCSCPDHLYRWEYALAKRDASYFTYSNAEPPVATNPKLVPGCCKHVVALASILRKKRMLPKTKQ